MIALFIPQYRKVPHELLNRYDVSNNCNLSHPNVGSFYAVLGRHSTGIHDHIHRKGIVYLKLIKE